MFANKFARNTFPEALDCLEQWHRNKVLRQATVPIDPSWLLATQSNSSSKSSYFNSSAGAWNHCWYPKQRSGYMQFRLFALVQWLCQTWEKEKTVLRTKGWCTVNFRVCITLLFIDIFIYLFFWWSWDSLYARRWKYL